MAEVERTVVGSRICVSALNQVRAIFRNATRTCWDRLSLYAEHAVVTEDLSRDAVEGVEVKSTVHRLNLLVGVFAKDIFFGISLFKERCLAVCFFVTEILGWNLQS